MKIEIINMDRERRLVVNLSGIVGFAGANRRGDVLLIQGLFNYIAGSLYPGAVGLGGENKIPEITGVINADTYSAISQFQIQNASSLLMSHFDGRIHPANYPNRKLHSNAKRMMSITLLHIMASDAAVMQGHSDYITGLAALQPELAAVIDQAVISS